MKRKLVAFPGWTSNPYVNLLCLAPRGAGWDVTTPKKMDDLIPTLRELRRGDVLHIHWLSPVFADVTEDADVTARAAAFCKLLDQMSQRGVRIFWTVHNIVTHDSAHYDHEVRASAHLAERAETIIILNEETPDIAAPHYCIPRDKVYLLPHSSYLGVYPQEVTREDARDILELGSEDLVVGFIGQVRPYKGIGLLIDAVSALHSSGTPVTLLIAGKTPDTEIDGLRKAVEACPTKVNWNPRFLPDTEIQTWFRASDVIAIPYAQVLNSGTAYLSATFGTPCVLPDEPQFRSLFGSEQWMTLFDRSAGSSRLADALLTHLPQRQEAVHSAQRFARDRTPFDMSLEYRGLLDR